jgi:uncharacterized protein
MLKKIISPLVPYLTISLGLFVFHNVWIAVLGYHLGMIIVVALTRSYISPALLFHSNNYKIPIISALICGCGGILLYLLWPFLSVQAEINSYLLSIGFTEKMWPFFLVYLICLNPLIEEYYWRGYLGSDKKRIILNDIIFAGYHILIIAGMIGVIWSILAFLILILAAWFWRQINRLSQGLGSSIAGHFMADTSIMLVIYFMRS